MDQDAEEAFMDCQALRAVELLMSVYARGGGTREQARKRLELHPISSPEAMVWFDIRWPP